MSYWPDIPAQGIRVVAYLMALYALGRQVFKERKLRKEIKELTDKKNIKSLQLVEGALVDMDLPLCAICKELLLLRVSTSLTNATKRLEALPSKVAESSGKPRVDMASIQKTLEKTIALKLWETKPTIDRPDDFITEVIKAYSSLIPIMQTADIRRANHFCVESFFSDSPIVKREAVRLLLPKLLVSSGGDPESVKKLIRVYREILRDFRGPGDESRLLFSIYGGLGVAANVNVRNTKDIEEIWELTFRAATANVVWAWGGAGGANIGTQWCNAMKSRIQRSGEDEIRSLGGLISRYLVKDDALAHSQSYQELGELLGNYIRPILDPGSGRYRQPTRAVVPIGENIPVEIVLKTNPTGTLSARLINFSLDNSDDKLKGCGAWATAEFNEGTKNWTENMDWREANIVIKYQGADILFSDARVKGPLLEAVANHRYFGFRIKLGKSFPEEDIWPLKWPWDNWPHR